LHNYPEESELAWELQLALTALVLALAQGLV
jgi:hypothetical protein